MLVTQPGVTSDAATGRGLGLAVNGQRPSASNFLLDGVENNNYLITGPLITVAPEAIQEYRVSTNNFSAEYGRTSGFVANAITRSGGESISRRRVLLPHERCAECQCVSGELDRFSPHSRQAGPAGILRRRADSEEPPVLFGSAYEYFRSRSRR